VENGELRGGNDIGNLSGLQDGTNTARARAMARENQESFDKSKHSKQAGLKKSKPGFEGLQMPAEMFGEDFRVSLWMRFQHRADGGAEFWVGGCGFVAIHRERSRSDRNRSTNPWLFGRAPRPKESRE